MRRYTATCTVHPCSFPIAVEYGQERLVRRRDLNEGSTGGVRR